MASKGGVLLVLGTVAVAVLLANRDKANPAPPGAQALTANDILAAANMADLDTLYFSLSDLFTAGQIDRATYEDLYMAYVTRYYQLAGG